MLINLGSHSEREGFFSILAFQVKGKGAGM